MRITQNQCFIIKEQLTYHLKLPKYIPGASKPNVFKVILFLFFLNQPQPENYNLSPASRDVSYFLCESSALPAEVDLELSIKNGVWSLQNWFSRRHDGPLHRDHCFYSYIPFLQHTGQGQTFVLRPWLLSKESQLCDSEHLCFKIPKMY